MTIFVFTPEGQLLGQFEIQSMDELSDGLSLFSGDYTLTPYCYIECEGQIWTLLQGADGFELHQGRLSPTDQTGATAAPYQPSPPAQTSVEADSPEKRYQDAYRIANSITAWGKNTKIMGGVFAAVILLVSLGMASVIQHGSPVLLGLVTAALVAAYHYQQGMLLCAQGQIMQATLDSAVHSSPFMTDEQRATAMSIKLK